MYLLPYGGRHYAFQQLKHLSCKNCYELDGRLGMCGLFLSQDIRPRRHFFLYLCNIWKIHHYLIILRLEILSLKTTCSLCVLCFYQPIISFQLYFWFFFYQIFSVHICQNEFATCLYLSLVRDFKSFKKGHDRYSRNKNGTHLYYINLWAKITYLKCFERATMHHHSSRGCN